ncbi:zinc finger, C2H2 type [Oesophagostomum dentatum]|uniref:Zinc finger, C2H2 type n=1 Tax=Oesophagostomum dentatum TaxID=61180 RepID=A0A0B1SU83_OESDE|nr:zinc finger, C2H2 type [Oesophagostomum dentatum]
MGTVPVVTLKSLVIHICTILKLAMCLRPMREVVRYYKQPKSAQTGTVVFAPVELGSSQKKETLQTHRPLDSEHAKQCPHCDRVYVSMPALSMHILTHKASHKCDICGKVFSRLWLLQGHLRSHTGQRPFGCAHCGKSFADRSNLRMHILTHTGWLSSHCPPRFCVITCGSDARYDK